MSRGVVVSQSIARRRGRLANLCARSSCERRRLGAAAKRRLRSDSGWTLIELLVVILILGIVLGAVLDIFDVANKTAYTDQERNTAMNEDQTGFNRMVGDLNQAYKIISPIAPNGGTTNADVVDFYARLTENGSQVDRRVQYVCDRTTGTLSSPWDRCLRYEGALTDSASAGQPMSDVTPSVVVPRIVNDTSVDPNDPVFTNLGNPDGSDPSNGPTYGDVVLKTPSTGQRKSAPNAHWVVFKDAFYTRQLTFQR